MGKSTNVQTSIVVDVPCVLESLATSTNENELKMKSVHYQSLSVSTSTTPSEPCANGPADSPMNMSSSYQQAHSILKSQSKLRSSPVRRHVSF